MTPATRRRRGLLLLLLAAACGSMAASDVRGRERAIRSQVGPLTPVVVSSRSMPARMHIGVREAGTAFVVARIPARFVPPGALRSPRAAVGATLAAGLPRGAYVTRSAFAADRRLALRPGDRAIDVEVSGGARLAALGGPGARVDVVVTTEPRDGAPRAFVAADAAELLALRRGTNGTAIATLRVPVRQAVFLTAATSFGRDARLLVRSPGDRSPAGRIGFAAR